MNGFMNYEEMFAQSIGLKEPWYIERAEFNEEKREVHIYVKVRKISKYECPECGAMCERYDDEEDERIWRHGDVVFFSMLCSLSQTENELQRAWDPCC